MLAPAVAGSQVLFYLHDRDDRPLMALRNAIAPKFQMSLTEDGSGSFALLRDDPVRRRVKRDCIVHVYVEGVDVWQWVIEDTSESYGESAADTITYSGRSTRVILDYAMIYPKGWTQPTADPRNLQYGASILANGDFTDLSVVAARWTLQPQPGLAASHPERSGVEKNDAGEVVGVALRFAAGQPLPDNTILAYQGNYFNHDQARPRNGTDTTWRLSAAVRVTNVAGNDYAAKLRLVWTDNQGRKLGEAVQGATMVGNWQTVELLATVPDAATAFRVDLLGRGQATIDFDLVRLQAVYVDALPQYPAVPVGPTRHADNLLHNGDWLAGTAYWNWITLAPTYFLESRTVDPVSGKPRDDLVRRLALRRKFPDIDGFVAYQDIPATYGRTYWGEAFLYAHFDYVSDDYNPLGYAGPFRILPGATQGPRTWLKRKWLDANGAQLGAEIETVATINTDNRVVDNGTLVELSGITAPEGAAFMRVELWAPRDYVSPTWAGLNIIEGVPDQPEDKVPGVWRAFRRKRIADIIRSVVEETRARVEASGDVWPVRCGTLELDQDYDIVDGVLIPKDERTAIFRFDNVGVALKALAQDAGDLTVRPARGEEPAGVYVEFRRQLGADRSRYLTFREGIDVIKVPKEHSGREVKTKLIVEGQGQGLNAIAVEVRDPALTAEYGLREGFLDRKTVPHLLDLRKDGKGALEDLATAATRITVSVTTQAWRPFQHYSLGDSVGVDVPHLELYGRYRIVGITCAPDQNNGLTTVDLDLDAAGYGTFVKVAKAQQAQAVSLSAAQRFPQGTVTLYTERGDDVLDAQTPYEFRFYVPNTPLYTNQVRLSFQGLPFRSTVKVTSRTIKTAQNAGVQFVIPAPTTLPTGETGESGGGSVDLGAAAIGNAEGAWQVSIGGHTHPFQELPHTHPAQLPGHTHDVTIPAVEYAIATGPKPTGLRAAVNGVALEPANYGYSDEGAEDLEVGRFIKKGWNTIAFSASGLGRVAVQLIIQAYLNTQIDDL